MTTRLSALSAAAALAIALAASAAPGQAADGSDGWMEPPTGSPLHHFGKTEDLDFLFGALKAAPDATSAKAVEQRIWAHWLISKSDTTNLLMTRVKSAVGRKDYDLALKLLDAVIELKPNYVEGWNRRATIHYMQKDFGAALADLEHVLKLEPRHFAALTGLGMIMQELGDDKRALDAYRKALAVYPRLERVPDIVKKLSEEVDGRDI
jgi:tetratricopeptide (TPR) repeat protein